MAQHDDALAVAQGRLASREYLAAFVDDLYLVTTLARARPALADVTRIVEQHASVAANLGKEWDAPLREITQYSRLRPVLEDMATQAAEPC